MHYKSLDILFDILILNIRYKREFSLSRCYNSYVNSSNIEDKINNTNNIDSISNEELKSDLTKQEELRNFVSELPHVPGCYLFKDTKGSIIYIGKAKNLRSRVGSYFNTGIEVGTKTHALVNRINDIQYIEAASELEAFILEAELIKKHRPKYNINLKDDKSYLYIVIRENTISNVNIPLIITARKTDLIDSDIVFGPYPDGTTAKYVVKTIRKIFPFRDCSSNKFHLHRKLNRPCLFGDLGLCTAPCVTSTSIDLELYKKNINQIKKLLSGEKISVLKNLKTEMEIASKEQNYEVAAKYRDLISKFEYITKSFRSPNTYMENPYLLDDIAQKSIEDLKDIIPNLTRLHKIPFRIECYDIANISGKEAVGSMVVATNGKIDKTEYKRFKIKLKNTPDDFSMLREVLFRRFSHLERVKISTGLPDKKLKTWPVPDLIVIDGGKGQLSSVLEVAKTLGIDVINDIVIVGLAKRLETIVYIDTATGEFKEIILDRNNYGSKLLIQLRDEAHRFGQKYHHYLRSKKLYT